MSDNASFAVISVPSGLVAGQSFTASVTLTNTGATIWANSGGTPVRIGMASPRDNPVWGPNRFPDFAAPVAPGQTVTLTGTFTAPAAGSYSFAVEMVREFVAWFGSVGSVPVTVAVNPNPPPPPPQLPVPAQRADPMDLVSFQPFPYFVYPGTNNGDNRLTQTWTNTTGRTLKIKKSYIWTGIDFGGTCDTDCCVRRQSDGTLIARKAWDHYQSPVDDGGKITDFGANCITILPGEVLEMQYLTNFFGGNMRAAHIVELWVEG